MIFRFGVIVFCSIAFGALGSAQETETTINKSLIPIQAALGAAERSMEW